MIRYQAAAIAFKLFSLNGVTRAAYRKLGNYLRNRQAAALPANYLQDKGYTEKAAWLITRLRQFRLLDKPSLRALEVGTGWMHYYGLTLALAADAKIDLYDVWDNRQFHRLRAAFRTLDPASLGLQPAEEERARQRLADVEQAQDFDSLYKALNKALNLNYHLDPGGRIDRLPENEFDLLFSMDVLEHIHNSFIANSISSMYRVLKPGGLSLHQLGVDDHLAHYDRHASPKQYLQYDDTTWRLRFQNEVQYFNRVSLDDILRMFRKAGFELVDKATSQYPAPLETLKIAPRFADQSAESLNATRLYLVHRKPFN